MNDNTLDNPFWQYACALYKKPNVADSILQLQDEHCLNVPVLLLLVWLGTQGIVVNTQDIHRFTDAILELDTNAIKPLRAIRRYIKSSPFLSAEHYESIKMLELSLEQQVLALLYQQSLSISSDSHETSCIERNLKSYILTGNNQQALLVQRLLGQIM